MNKQKRQLEEAVDYIYSYIEQLNEVSRSLDREGIDVSHLTTGSNLCIKVAENILAQVELIERSEEYENEKEERWGTDKKKDDKKDDKKK